MGPLPVVLLAKRREALLLLLHILGRWAGRLRFESSMHPFMAAVLLWLARQDPLMDDPQLHPPDAQPREAAEPHAGEGTSVIRSDRCRQTVLSKQALEDRLCAGMFRRREAVTPQQVPTCCITHRQRVAPLSILSAELTLEVRTPNIIWCGIREIAQSGGR